MTCASRPCPPPRSSTRPPRNSRRTRRAISHASYSSFRGRQPAWHTVRAEAIEQRVVGKPIDVVTCQASREAGENIAGS